MKKTNLHINFFFFLVIIANQLCFSQISLYPSIQINETRHAKNLFDEGITAQKSSLHKEAIKFFKESLLIYQNLKNRKEAGECLLKIGISYYFQGDYHNALSFYKQSIKIYEEINFKKGISSATNNIGAIYYRLGNLLKALEYYKRSFEIQKELNDPKIVEATTQNIGGIYYNIGDYKNALIYYSKSYDIVKKLDDSLGIAIILNSIGQVLIKQRNFEEAHLKLKQAKKIAEERNDKRLRLGVILNFGELFFVQNDLLKSFYYFEQGMTLSSEINSPETMSSSYISMGTIFNVKGKQARAIEKCKIGLAIAADIGSLSLQKDACDCLHKGYKGLGNDKQALYFYEKYIAFKDSLRSGETSNKMLSMEFQNQQLTDSIAFVNKEHAIKLKHTEEIKQKENQRNIGIVSLIFLIIVALGLWNRLSFVRKSKKTIQLEKDISEKLLLNILPGEIASELKAKGKVNAKDFNPVSILFSDFKSFTQTAEKMTPHELVEEINTCFKAFDCIVEKYGIEKIKTIGDSYMAAGGIPVPNSDSLNHIVLAGLEMQEFMRQRLLENRLEGKPAFEMRVGIHAGPIVAGVVGIKKFQYDVWGDTVNTASRMESNGSVGRVNISENLYQLLKENELFSFEYRGNIRVKGKGNMNMYFVENKEKKVDAATFSLVRGEYNS